jgi:hypothetical protein
MSRVDDFFDEDPEPKPSEGAPDIQPGLSPERKITKSRVDDVIEAVEGIQRRIQPKKCAECGGRLARRGPTLGGAQRLRCVDCRLEIPWASTQSAAVTFGPIRAQGGPYYTGEPRSAPRTDLPPFRMALERKGDQ